MSWFYPRTVSIQRPKQTRSIGSVPYGGLTTMGYDPILDGVQAGIQRKAYGSKALAGLPSDGSKVYWEILMPGLSLGTVLDRDVIIDDLGVRYLVIANYWTPLNYQCMCERLEV